MVVGSVAPLVETMTEPSLKPHDEAALTAPVRASSVVASEKRILNWRVWCVCGGLDGC